MRNIYYAIDIYILHKNKCVCKLNYVNDFKRGKYQPPAGRMKKKDALPSAAHPLEIYVNVIVFSRSPAIILTPL